MTSKLSFVAVSCAVLITVTGNLGARSVIGAPAAAQPNLSHAGATLRSKGLSTSSVVTQAIFVTQVVSTVVTPQIYNVLLQTATVMPQPQVAATRTEAATLDQ